MVLEDLSIIVLKLVSDGKTYSANQKQQQRSICLAMDSQATCVVGSVASVVCEVRGNAVPKSLPDLW